MGISQDQINDFLSGWGENLQGVWALRIVAAIVLLVVGYWLIQFASRRVDRLMKRTNIDDTLFLFFSHLFTYSMYALLAITLLSVVGVPMTSVIAVLGAAALAVGLALQDSLKNVASSVLIIILKPYVVDDTVEINDRRGLVREVGLYHTSIRTPDNKMLLIPNSQVMSENIINFSSLDFIRVDMIFGIGYGDDIRKAKEVVEQIMASDDRILEDPAPIIAVHGLGESSVDLAVQPFALLQDAIAIRYYVTEQVKLRFDEAGITIPFPQRDLHMIQVTPAENGDA